MLSRSRLPNVLLLVVVLAGDTDFPSSFSLLPHRLGHSERMFTYYARRRRLIELLLSDSHGQEIMIGADMKKWSPTQTVGDVITAFAGPLYPPFHLSTPPPL